MPFVRHLVGDAAGYYAWSREIAAGSWIGTEAFYQAPLYPYILAVCLTLSGEGVWAVRLMQAVWGAVGVGCLGLATSRVFDRRVGIVAAIMLAVYAPAIFFDGIVQKASLACMIVCVMLLAMAWLGTLWTRVAAGALGVAVGLLVLTRENAIVWVPVLALWVWVSERQANLKMRLGGTVVYVVGLGLVLVPVGMRNALVCGEWSVSTFQAGPNFYIGNSAESNGRYRPLVRGHETPAFERRDATALAESALGRRLTPREVSAHWMSRARVDIQADPLRWLRLCGLKMLMVWNRYEVSDVESQYLYADYSAVLRWPGRVWHFGILCPLAALGAALTWRQWRRLWVYHVMIISMACSVALFYVMARYRFPLVPLLIPFAAVGCVCGARLAGSGGHRRLVGPGLIAIVVAAIVNFPLHDERQLNAMARMNLGVALAGEGDLEAATSCFRRAVEDHPGSAEAQNNLAQALAMQDDHGGAIPHYRAAVAIEPDLIGVEYNLAVSLERVGHIEAALTHYERGLEIDPSDVQARQAIDRLRGSE